ncbi:hypothetical protein ASPBRDRAFT_137337 [Aspergillus brasiliensis CBS 101740]|uniref:non-specific serine/threonine protein kinase n=1 Tax=Aspergillus brasiliensis (strain CBS 101740 / IMI 381727 / IBT 21946) TaxID=767769 RepID=A0A1L9U4Z0_ASPBC|nr:hypothetical protein ASPBRDRAFT_137337 [Aspergillus brasiliensis CBS 101740]
MPSTIAIAKNSMCFKLPFSEFSLSSLAFPSWHTHTHTPTTNTTAAASTTSSLLLSEADTDTDKTLISEESPLLPPHHHHHRPSQQSQQEPTLKDKYGTCTTILHYGTSSSVRLYTTTTTAPKKEKRKREHHVVKTLRPTPSSSSTKTTLKSTLESLLSSTLSHPHLLRTIDILPNSRGETCLVSVYCELGDLGMYISSKSWGNDMINGGEREKRDDADKIFYQIMSAVEFLHEMGIVHGGLCVENVFLSCYPNGVCVYPLVRGLSMGIQKFEKLEEDTRRGRCASRRNPYLAPEVLSFSPTFHSSSIYRRHGYGKSSRGVGDGPRAVDIWAAGIIYLVLRLGRIIWRSASEDEDGRYAEYLMGRKRREGYGVIEGLGEAQCRNVVYAMLNPDANRRIKASEVMRSEWMYNLDIHQ